jgi:DNA-binding transcriptional ArsR family regulator
MADADSYGRDPAAVRELEENFTSVLVSMGVPRMIARVLASLSVTDSGSLTSAELVQRLRVSPASISKAVSYLEAQQLVRRERDGRRERYVVDGDVWYQASVASARTNDELAEAALKGAEILGPDTPAGARLGDTGRFLMYLGADILERAEYWRKALAEGAAGGPATAARRPG